MRGMAHNPMPPHTGGKLKPSSAFKERFRTTGTGKIKYQRAGHVHKRFNKSNRQRRELGQPKIMHSTYAKILKKLGFVSRFY